MNSEVIYASTWRVRRSPYDFSSGGDGSALWKSNDGGATWKEISKNEGFPEGTLGIIGVTVSPVNPDRVWTIVENEKGGVYRSDDGGKTWDKIHKGLPKEMGKMAIAVTRSNSEKVYALIESDSNGS